MLKEVFERRFSKIIKNKKQTDVIIPDLVVIDGGKGQYSVGRKILDVLDKKNFSFDQLYLLASEKSVGKNTWVTSNK